MTDSRLYPSGKGASFFTKFVSGVLRYYRKSDGVEFFSIDGANMSFAGKQRINLAAASQTLTPQQSGQRFVGVVDAVFQLPTSSSLTKGVWYEFECGALSVGTGLSISPGSADSIAGNGLTSVVNKDLINTGGTDAIHDSVVIYGTGATGVTAWIIKSMIGTWAKQG